MSYIAFRFCAVVSFLVAFFCAYFVSGLALADVVVAQRTMRAGEVISAADVRLVEKAPANGAASSVDEVIGKEARVSLYQGRPVRPDHIGPVTLIRRNDIVTLTFQKGPLQLRSEGRALDKGGLGERIRVMNLDSRLTVFGEITGPGVVSMR